MITIKQILMEEWTGQDGKIRTEVIGLGDDNLMYRWHRGTGKWILYVLTSNN